jgi:hypothetical protein
VLHLQHKQQTDTKTNCNDMKTKDLKFSINRKTAFKFEKSNADLTKHSKSDPTATILTHTASQTCPK